MVKKKINLIDISELIQNVYHICACINNDNILTNNLIFMNYVNQYQNDKYDQLYLKLNISEKKQFNKINNVETILGSETSIQLPIRSVDKILMVDVYHEFNFPIEMIASIKNALKPEGQLFLIEYRGEDPKVPIKKIHKMTENQAVKEMEAAGFKLKSNITNLPWQHCMIFVLE